MLTHKYENFPSDVFTMMAAVGATITVGEEGCVQVHEEGWKSVSWICLCRCVVTVAW